MQPVQIRMARAALGLSVDELARRAGVAPHDISGLEDGAAGDLGAIQSLNLFLSASGIELIDGDGVRAKPPQSESAVTVDELTTENDGGEG